MKLQATFYILAAFVATALSATVAQMKANVEAINSIVKMLKTDINNVPNSRASLPDVAAIQDDVTNLEAAMGKGTEDAKTFTGYLSESDGQSILEIFKAMEPSILDSLGGIVVKKDAINGLDGGIFTPTIVTDLKSLKLSTSTFGSSVVGIVPADIKPEALAIMDDIIAAFDPAIAVYTS